MSSRSLASDASSASGGAGGLRKFLRRLSGSGSASDLSAAAAASAAGIYVYARHNRTCLATLSMLSDRQTNSHDLVITLHYIGSWSWHLKLPDCPLLRCCSCRRAQAGRRGCGADLRHVHVGPAGGRAHETQDAVQVSQVHHVLCAGTLGGSLPLTVCRGGNAVSSRELRTVHVAETGSN